jgi:uncharacterized protein (TIGR00255 family)
MLRSMTGFGAAVRENDAVAVDVELKSVNGRFLKTNVRTPASLSSREPEIEARVRAHLHRGSVTVTVHVNPRKAEAVVAVNEEVVRAYQEVFRKLGLSEERIPTLPGVLGTSAAGASPEEWDLVSRALDGALEQLVIMREHEGAALGEALGALLDRVEAGAGEVRTRAPDVVREYQRKLHERLTTLLGAGALPVEPDALAREVALYADRCDVTEEVDRLDAHIAQARTVLRTGGEVGRTLEFLAQEMHREVNTIGSKSSDTEISRLVVALKTELEKLKEQVANVE